MTTTWTSPDPAPVEPVADTDGDGRPLLQGYEVQALLDEWRLADEAAAGLPFDHEIDHHGLRMSLRMVHVHLIGEYARHNGHADLLRQALDGVTGR